MSLQLRLAKLSHAQLLELATDACKSSPELKNKADALIAQVAPLPAWCVDILMSPDLLPQLFSSLGLSEHAAAGVCTTWSRAYSRQLRRCCYIDPTRVRWLADVPFYPNGLCMLPGGVLAITSCDLDFTEIDETDANYDVNSAANFAMKFVAARSDTDPQALAACRASSLAARRFEWPMGMARTNDGLLACNHDYPSTALYKFALNASMDELAAVPALAEYGGGFRRCAVHQQTQRAFALGEDKQGAEKHPLFILDSHLQVIATVEATVATRPVLDNDDEGPSRDVAVHGDQVIVLTGDCHPEGPGLRLLDLDGRFLRTIAAGKFRNPHAVTAVDGRAFVVDDCEEKDEENEDGEEEDDEDGEARWRVNQRAVLHVIEIHSGNILQTAPLELSGRSISSIIVDGDEIYIADFNANKVIALRFAGSEA